MIFDLREVSHAEISEMLSKLDDDDEFAVTLNGRDMLNTNKRTYLKLMEGSKESVSG